MEQQQLIGGIFMCVWLILIGVLTSSAQGKIIAIYERYGIRRQQPFDRWLNQKDIIGESDWTELKKLKRRRNMIFIVGGLLLIIGLAVNGICF